MTSERAPIRIAHIITKLAVGGAQESVVVTCTGLSRTRFEQFIVSGTETDTEGSLWHDERLAGTTIVPVPELVRAIRPLRDLRSVIALVRVIRDVRPDIVHTHSSKAGIVGRLAARIARVPIVVHSVHGWSFHDGMSSAERRLAVAFERLAARWTKTIVVESSTDLPKGQSRRIGRGNQYALIRNGIQLRRFEAHRGERSAARALLGLGEEPFVAGTVGRLADQKDPLSMVAAWALVHEADPSAKFVWIGDGPLRGEAEELRDRLGLTSSFEFGGVRSDIEAVLPALDCFVLSSRWEGLPRTLTEAMAAGVPVVVTAVDGSVEAVEHGRTGLLVPPGRPAELAAAINHLCESPDVGRQLAEQALTTAEQFSDRTMLRGLGELYEDLVCGRQSPRGERPLKAVHVITGLGYGGAERQLQALATHSDPSAVVHEIISLTDLGPIGAELRAAGVSVSEVGMRSGRPDPMALRRVRSLLARSGADLVQTWLYHGDLVGGLVARSLRLPVVWSVRMTWMDEARTKRSTIAAARLCARLSGSVPTRIVFNSARGRSTHADRGYSVDQSEVIANGIDRARFRPDTDAGGRLRDRLGLGPDSDLVGSVARFDPQKGHDLLAEAMVIVLRHRPDARLILAGPGCSSTNGDLMSLLTAAGVVDRTKLLGPLEDVQAVLAGLDVFVSSSRYGESVPNVVLEALACGVPVVATDVADVSAALADGLGRVVTPGDSGALGDAIAAVLCDRASATQRGRIDEDRTPSHEETAARYLRVYEQVLSARR